MREKSDKIKKGGKSAQIPSKKIQIVFLYLFNQPNHTTALLGKPRGKGGPERGQDNKKKKVARKNKESKEETAESVRDAQRKKVRKKSNLK